MERTESLVVQVAPSFEQDKIKEMETFGWNLQGRQEIHEEGDAYGRPSYIDSSTYVVKTTVKHYVKLHFVRAMSLPNLDRIRQIESEYNNLPFPRPPGLGWPIGLTAFFALGVIIGNPEDPVTARIVFAVLTALCGYWLSRRLRKRKNAIAVCQESAAKARQLLEQAASLL
jgi:hypothetical protein